MGRALTGSLASTRAASSAPSSRHLEAHGRLLRADGRPAAPNGARPLPSISPHCTSFRFGPFLPAAPSAARLRCPSLAVAAFSGTRPS
eukprot:3872642-Alexandrium_andersonii.AAC.1